MVVAVTSDVVSFPWLLGSNFRSQSGLNYDFLAESPRSWRFRKSRCTGAAANWEGPELGFLNRSTFRLWMVFFFFRLDEVDMPRGSPVKVP